MGKLSAVWKDIFSKDTWGWIVGASEAPPEKEASDHIKLITTRVGVYHALQKTARDQLGPRIDALAAVEESAFAYLKHRGDLLLRKGAKGKIPDGPVLPRGPAVVGGPPKPAGGPALGVPKLRLPGDDAEPPAGGPPLGVPKLRLPGNGADKPAPTGNSGPFLTDAMQSSQGQPIDIWVKSLHSRCLKKGAYLDALMHYYGNGTDLLDNVDSFETHLLARHKEKFADASKDEVNLVAEALLEQLDPFHRKSEFSLTVTPDRTNIARSDNPMDGALASWYGSRSNIPFFLYLEGHPVCTDSVVDSPNYQSEKARTESVIYRSLEHKIITFANRQVLYKTVAELFDDQVKNRPLDSAKSEADGQGAPISKGEAFIWNTDGTVLSHKHTIGKFHHSSFNGGQKVKCAGMWKVKNGKVQKISNNSGHYKPNARHMLNFVGWLAQKGVIDIKCSISIIDPPLKFDYNMEGSDNSAAFASLRQAFEAKSKPG